MARRPRLRLSGFPFHLVQRGNNRQPVFLDEQDRLTYLSELSTAAALEHCELHAYVLMNNHVHLLVTGKAADSLSRMMQRLGARYVRYFNTKHGRTGTLWEGRFHASLIETEHYLLACQRYIELNPVRARMAGDPAEYHWSSHGFNAWGTGGGILVTPHASYQSLGSTTEARQLAYRKLFEQEIPAELMTKIRHGAHGNWAVGSKPFLCEARRQSGQQVAEQCRGGIRPGAGRRKTPSDPIEILEKHHWKPQRD